MKLVEENSGWTDRGFLIGLTLLFVFGWMNLLARLYHGWAILQQVERYWAVSFAITYPLPWILLLLKRSNKYVIALFAYLAFFAALKLRFP